MKGKMSKNKTKEESKQHDNEDQMKQQIIQHQQIIGQEKQLGKHELFINTEDQETRQQVLKEVAGYSITPTTLKSREILSDSTYVENYNYNGNEVLRFGINTSKIIIGKKDIINLMSQSQSSINSKKYTQEDAQNIKHEPLEIELIHNAITYLLTTDAKTALIDIFAREKGIIKTLENGCAETHTVVLYKNPLKQEKYEISVIDPSNFLFSSHLSNINAIFQHELFDKITTIHKTLQIYKPIGDNVGSNPYQYRDCIDIAVKLAFGLNKMDWIPIDLKSVETLDIVKVISNCDMINDCIPKNITTKDHFVNLPLRIQQKSNIKIEEDFYKFSKAIKENITDIVKKDTQKDLQSLYIETLTSADQEKTIDTLETLHNICGWIFNQKFEELELQKAEVLGEGFNSNLYDI